MRNAHDFRCRKSQIQLRELQIIGKRRLLIHSIVTVPKKKVSPRESYPWNNLARIFYYPLAHISVIVWPMAYRFASCRRLTFMETPIKSHVPRLCIYIYAHIYMYIYIYDSNNLWPPRNAASSGQTILRQAGGPRLGGPHDSTTRILQKEAREVHDVSVHLMHPNLIGCTNFTLPSSFEVLGVFGYGKKGPSVLVGFPTSHHHIIQVLEAKRCSLAVSAREKAEGITVRACQNIWTHLDTSTQKWPTNNPSELLNILQGPWNIPNPNTAFWKATPLKELPYIVRCLLCLIHQRGEKHSANRKCSKELPDLLSWFIGRRHHLLHHFLAEPTCFKHNWGGGGCYGPFLCRFGRSGLPSCALNWWNSKKKRWCCCCWGGGGWWSMTMVIS